MSVKRTPPFGGADYHKLAEMPKTSSISTPTRYVNANNISSIASNIMANDTNFIASSSGPIYTSDANSNTILQNSSKKRGRDSPAKPKKVNKQQKLQDYWLSKPSEYRNQFDILACEDDENDTQITTQEPPRQTKPPPIYVSGVENIQPLKKLLQDIADKNYELKLLKENELKIQPKTIEMYQVITKALVDQNTEFHTFRPKQDKTYNIVLKGIHSSTPIEEIKEEIENMGHEVSNISNIKNRISKQPLPMFYINLKPKANNKDIYKCTAILHTKISFEPPRKKREIAQCTRCQRYGHTKSYCHHNPRCVKCSENHLTTECPRKTRSDKVRCVLCNGNHPANYKGCSIYKDLQEKTFPRLRQRKPQEIENMKTNVNSNSNSKFNSYSDEARSSINNINQEDCNQPASQQNEGFSKLQRMMETLIEQMTTMMSLLNTVITKLVK